MWNAKYIFDVILYFLSQTEGHYNHYKRGCLTQYAQALTTVLRTTAIVLTTVNSCNPNREKKVAPNLGTVWPLA